MNKVAGNTLLKIFDYILNNGLEVKKVVPYYIDEIEGKQTEFQSIVLRNDGVVFRGECGKFSYELYLSDSKFWIGLINGHDDTAVLQEFIHDESTLNELVHKIRHFCDMDGKEQLTMCEDLLMTNFLPAISKDSWHLPIVVSEQATSEHGAEYCTGMPQYSIDGPNSDLSRALFEEFCTNNQALIDEVDQNMHRPITMNFNVEKNDKSTTFNPSLMKFKTIFD